MIFDSLTYAVILVVSVLAFVVVRLAKADRNN